MYVCWWIWGSYALQAWLIWVERAGWLLWEIGLVRNGCVVMREREEKERERDCNCTLSIQVLVIEQRESLAMKVCGERKWQFASEQTWQLHNTQEELLLGWSVSLAMLKPGASDIIDICMLMVRTDLSALLSCAACFPFRRMSCPLWTILHYCRFAHWNV